MNAAPIEPRPWPRSRWWLLIACVFAAHIGMIVALGDRGPIVPRRVVAAPVLRLATDSGEFLALSDPTLFALPHRQGFAGAAWLQVPAHEFHPFEWSEAPRWLTLPVEPLGTVFTGFMQTNRFARFELEVKPPPELTVPELAPEPSFATQSTLRIQGDLVRRKLLNPPELPSWPGAELLTNSVVGLLVSAEGDVISLSLLPPGSGSKEADQRALELARAARFEPVPRTDGGAAKPAVRVIWGWLIFEWHTTPLSATNTPAATP